MSEPFPSKAYRELCIKHQKELREEWEPQDMKPGDFYWNGKRAVTIKFTPQVRHQKPMLYEAWMLRQGIVPLPRLDQLIEMLEERRYYPGIWKVYGRYPDECWEVKAKAWDTQKLVCPIATIQALGPDPETAMLRAWLEVVKDE